MNVWPSEDVPRIVCAPFGTEVCVRAGIFLLLVPGWRGASSGGSYSTGAGVKGCWVFGVLGWGTACAASTEPPTSHPSATSCPALPLLSLGGRATELWGLENQAGIYSNELFQPVVFQQKGRTEALKSSRVHNPRVIPFSYTSISLWSSARNLLNSCSCVPTWVHAGVFAFLYIIHQNGNEIILDI